MDPVRLRSLLAVAERGSFSRAAAALGIAQPSLSRQIALLESEAGAPLLYRNGRGATLTEYGQRLADAARPLLAGLDGLAGVVREDAVPRGSVALGTPTFIAAHLAGPLFGEFRQRFPEIRVRLMDGFSGHVNQWLVEGRADAAILYDARHSHTLSAELLGEERLCVFGHRDRLGELPAGLREDGAVPPEALSRIELILPGRHHGLRRALDRAGAGGDPGRVLEVDSLTALRALVEDGVGWSVLPHAGVRREAADPRFVVRPIGTPPLAVRLLLATASAKTVTPATRATLRFVRELVARFRRDGVMSA